MESPEELLLKRVGAHKLHYGREDSFKLSPGRLLASRFLIGIRTAGVPAHAFVDIAAGIGIPERFKTLFLQHLGEADVVLYGLEDGESGLVYKAYLEFWQKVRREVAATGSREPTLLNLGFKWSAGDGATSVVSRYTCYPMLDLAGVLRRMRALYGAPADAPSCRFGQHLVQLAARTRTPTIYMEVGEEGTQRRSYDINVYKAGLTLAAVEPVLREAAAQYGFPGGQFDAFYSGLRPRLLGHLSGGMARDGSDFLTVYYETKPL